ncbi:NAD(P)H-hydrate epimerase, partial [Thermodesulfobacteriota bacterium]
MRLVKAEEIKEMDRISIQEIGIPGSVLMENAARGATGLFLDHFSPPDHSRVAVLCGRGNNGGDGYVVARYLHEAGHAVSVVVLSALEKIAGDALTNLEIIKRMELDIFEVPGRDEWPQARSLITVCDFVIDGIFGTGLNSPVRDFYAEVIKEVNALNKAV